MAWSAHKDAESVEEHFMDDGTLDRYAGKLADLIRGSSYLVAFTGAGISTSAGIPDFRGPEGVWTMRAQGKQATAKTSTMKASPTPAHMALVALQQAGALKFVISQNCDGLHRRSGLRSDLLAELHGNTNLESCRACGKEYLRDYSCRRHSNAVHQHETGRLCVCGHELHDSIVNFGEPLPEKTIKAAFVQSERADVFVVLGSSLTVSPANEMPRVAKQKGRLVVCNLQKTPLDQLADVRIFAKADDLMVKVLQKLELPLPEWLLHREVVIEFQRSSTFAGVQSLTVAGIEPDGTPATILSAVEDLQNNNLLREEPFVLQLGSAAGGGIVKVQLNLHFMGHFNEPPLPLKVEFDASKPQNRLHYKLQFNPRTGQWNSTLAE